MSKDQMKKNAAIAALEYIEAGTILGIGTGSTVNFFIDELAKVKHKIEAAVSSSKQSTERLKRLGIQIIDLNTADDIPIYVDGADEVNHHLQMIKGGGGALTGEKIVASVAQKFICIADQNKLVETLGIFPVAVEVIPTARSYVAREIVKLGGNPQYREGFISDWGNVILDVYHLPLLEPLKMEETLNNITGVVTNGIFAKNPADITLLGTQDGSVKKFGN
ncbi:MAG: ribose-5-phosphate isomerase RpiA [Gammaproteobacteria bacterium]|jgi:ribose 5-phosphate isomerase A